MSVIGSARGTEYLLVPTVVEEVLRERHRRPLFFIDLGVPRNFDPRLNELDNVFLYDIDDLKKVIGDNKDEREREAVKAEAIVAEEVEAFWTWLSSVDATPLIVALREKAEAIRKRELERTLATFNRSPAARPESYRSAECVHYQQTSPPSDGVSEEQGEGRREARKC